MELAPSCSWCDHTVQCPTCQALTLMLFLDTCNIPISGANLWQLKVYASFSTLTFVSFVVKISMFIFHSIFEDKKKQAGFSVVSGMLKCFSVILQVLLYSITQFAFSILV